jgi:protein-tyrosine phosphatase
MFSLMIRRDGLIEPPAMAERDAHCHIVPGLDDGAKDDKSALAIALLLCEMGVRQVVATPHVISDLYPNTTAGILEGVDKLRSLLDASKIALDVLPGAEYYAEGALLSRIDKGDLLAFGEEKYVLFESPVEYQPMVLEEIVFHLLSAGYTPLLAHVERYRFLQKEFSAVTHLREIGVRFQVNHSSFLLPKTSGRGEMARKLYIKGLVDALGTDMHRASSLEKPTQPAEHKPTRRFGIGR